MMGSGVTVTGVRKRFGRLEVLRGVDLTVAPGRITAIVGPNAAGKSTLIKMMLGLVKPSAGAGSIVVDGVPINGGPGYRERVGYMPQAARFPEHLSGREIIAFLSDLRGHPDRLDKELLDLFRLEAALDRPIRVLSGGTLQKLNAVVAFLFRPSLVILDEPTAGLDPIASGVLKDKIRRASAAGITVLLTGHIMSEIEELAQDIVFMVDGEVWYQGTVDKLLVESGENRLERAIARLLERADR
jgi:Cu-processing system ATP-binding protein